MLNYKNRLFLTEDVPDITSQMEQMYTSSLRNIALWESGNSRDMRGMWRGWGGEINVWVPQLNWIASEDRLRSRAQTGKDSAELVGWQSEDTCKLSFHWLVKIGGIGVRVCDTKIGEKVAGKIRPRGAQGSIELNINSSLCFGKNSHKSLQQEQTTKCRKS